MPKSGAFAVSSVLYSRNGISGRPFYAGIIDNPFGFPDGDPQGPYLVVSLNDPRLPQEPSPAETFVLRVADINAGELASPQRGDNIDLRALQAIRDIQERKLDQLLAASEIN